jgi:hypothetical protein
MRVEVPVSAGWTTLRLRPRSDMAEAPVDFLNALTLTLLKSQNNDRIAHTHMKKTKRIAWDWVYKGP